MHVAKLIGESRAHAKIGIARPNQNQRMHVATNLLNFNQRMHVATNLLNFVVLNNTGQGGLAPCMELIKGKLPVKIEHVSPLSLLKLAPTTLTLSKSFHIFNIIVKLVWKLMILP